MSKLITVHFTVRGHFIKEVPDDFKAKVDVDKGFIEDELGIKELLYCDSFADIYYQIDFRLGKEDK